MSLGVPLSRQLFRPLRHDLVKEGGVTISRTLGDAMERLRKNHYHLWKAFCEAREDLPRLEEWRHAPRGSQEWRKAIFYDQALLVLEISMRG